MVVCRHDRSRTARLVDLSRRRQVAGRPDPRSRVPVRRWAFLSVLTHSKLAVRDVRTTPLSFPVVDLALRATAALRIVPYDSLSEAYLRRPRLLDARRLRIRVPGYGLLEVSGNKVDDGAVSMKTTPLISVTVPTRNSERTLERCLQSVRDQDVPTEVIVADDCSTDRSPAIAAAFGAQVLTGPLPLLEARIRAAEAASTGVVVLLDADQFLRQGVLERCLEMLVSNDALVLEEESSPPSSWVSGLLAADKRLLHHLSDHHLTPGSGSLLPRVFKSQGVDACIRAHSGARAIDGRGGTGSRSSGTRWPR